MHRIRHTRASIEQLEHRILLASDLPLISEFMASNDDTIRDGFGESPDWIEIRNPTNLEHDLAGWSLTDDPLDLGKWTFPDHVSSQLDPFEYLVVFASDRDTVDPANNLHTNFKISAGGEYLALVNEQGNIVSEFGSTSEPFPEQETDISYGIEGATLLTGSIHYVDASAGIEGNTKLTVPQNGSSIFEPSGIDIRANQGNDGLWEQRTFANGGTIFETGIDTGSDNGQALTTSIEGLAAGTYQLFGYFWSDTNGNWDMRFGLEADSLRSYRPTTQGVRSLGSLADTDGLADTGFTSPVLVHEGNRTLYQVTIGERTISDGEAIDVFVDDAPNSAGRSWFDGVGFRQSQTVIDRSSSAFHLVPTSDDLGTRWTEVDFDPIVDGFTAGFAAVGYENSPGSDTSFAPFIATRIPSGSVSTYLRIPFELQTAQTVTGLHLSLQFDDGFVAYLNGQRILDQLAPNQLDHQSRATDSRPDDDVLATSSFTLNRWANLLKDGENVLSFHVLNASSNSTDLLLNPELLVSAGAEETGEVRFFDTPTPGGPNGLGFLGFVADTKFSFDRGFYDQPFDVQISTKTDGADIYYTVDGSEPHPDNASAVLYEAAINVSRTTNLRAAAYKDGFRPTNVDTQTYIFLGDVLVQNPRSDPNEPREYPARWEGGFRGDYVMDSRVVEQWSDDNPNNTDATLTEGLLSIPTISLTLDHDDLWDSSDGIYMNASKRGESWRRSGSIEYIDPNSDDEFQYNVGIAMHGASSSLNDRLLKHSFRLRFSPQYDGPSKLNFPLFDNSDFDDINQVILRAAFTDAFGTRTVNNRYSPLDSTYLRDVWMRDAQLATGGTAAQSGYAHLYVNGLYWGLYNSAERSTDERFFTSHFGGEEDDWDILRDFNQLSSGNRRAWNAMFGIARSINAANADEKFFEIQGKDDNGVDDPNRTNYLNMDRFIDYMLLHIFAGVEDWPHHNWHAGFNRENPGLGFEFHTWDQEIALDQLVRDRTEAADSDSPGELYQELRQSTEFRLRVADRIQTLFFNDGPLNVENNQSRWMARVNQIDSAIIGESARWGDAREGQQVVAYSSRSPLPSGTGAVPRGTQTIPLITVDHWRDSVTYVNETFFPGAFDIFLDRMRRDDLLPNTEAPIFAVNGQEQHGGELLDSDTLTIQGGEAIFFTTDGSDPRQPGGNVGGERFVSPLVLTESTTVNARVFANGNWSPLTTATFVPSRQRGDVSGDAVVDDQDIDALFAAIASNVDEDRFDLNGDNEVSAPDADFLIQRILGTRRGDFDLDGTIDFADFLTLSANFGQQSDARWSDGDANGDGTIDFADFLLVSQNFG